MSCLRPQWSRRIRLALTLVFVIFAPHSTRAQEVIATTDFRVVGLELRVSPEQVFTPKGIPGSVLVELVTGSGAPSEATAALAKDAHISAVLRGPAFPAHEVLGVPGEPLMLPPIALSGDYRLDDVRLVDTDTGAVLMEGTPRGVPVTVFDDVLVARVTSRPLTLEEIAERDIVIDESSFDATEFEVGFVIDGEIFNVTFPVVSPRFDETTEIIPAAELDELLAQAEAINDMLALTAELPPELETAGLDVQVKGLIFQKVEGDGDEASRKYPSVPGLLVIPGNIGYLHQFFSVQVFVSNAAPAGSGLSVHDLTATIALPPGKDLVVGSGDDPLRMARIGSEAITAPTVTLMAPGADGEIGTSDDSPRLRPGDTGQAELLVEGLREGLHPIDVELSAVLDGLAAGEVPIDGSAAGAVLVRNPSFSVTFVHPRTIRRNEPYTASVIVLNTSDTPANLVSVTLAKASISGARLESDETVQIGTLPPGESGMATFTLTSLKTGSITFSNFSGDDNVSGSFSLTMGVDERGVALSPAAIGYPELVGELPADLRAAADRVLGQALSVATAGRLPPGVIDVSRQVVIDRVRELAEAGQRLRYGDPPERVYADLVLDWLGGRHASSGFDQILATTDAGRQFRNIVAISLGGVTLADRADDLAGRHEAWTIAEGTATLVPSRTRLGQPTGAAIGTWLATRPSDVSSAQDDVARWDAVADHGGASLHILDLPGDGVGLLTTWGVPAASVGTCYIRAGVSANLSIDAGCDASVDGVLVGSTTVVRERPPEVVTVRQDVDVNAGRPYPSCLMDPPYLNYGTVVAVLFSKPMAQAGVDVPSGYRTDHGVRGTSVRIQPGGRVALVNLRTPIGALTPHSLDIAGVTDPSGAPLEVTGLPIELPAEVGVSLKGRVLGLDGAPVAGVPVTIVENDQLATPIGCVAFDVRVTQTMSDENGSFAFDFLMAGVPYTVAATDTSGLSDAAIAAVLQSLSQDKVSQQKLADFVAAAGDKESILAGFAAGNLGDAIVKAQGLDRAIVKDYVVASSGRVGTEVPIVLRFRGRGSVEGVVRDAAGTPMANVAVNLFPDQDSRELGRGMFSENDGTFRFSGVPLGIFTVNATSSSGLKRTVADRLVEPGETKVLDVVMSAAPVPVGRLLGRVVEADETPHGGARVIVQVPGSVRALVTADADGYFEAPRLATANDYSVIGISVDGRRMGRVDGVAVTQDSDTWTRVTLQTRATVHGRVQFANGVPAAGALVAGGEALVRTDDAGLFTTDGVPTGQRTIAAALERDPDRGLLFTRFGSGNLEVTAGDGNFVTLTLDEVGRIEGFVRNAQGVPLGRVRVAIPQTGGFFVTTSNDAGLYAFDRLGLGGYTLSAPAPGVDEDVEAQLKAEPPATAVDELAAVMGIIDPPLVVGSPEVGGGVWGYTRTSLDYDGHVRVQDVQLQPAGTVSGVVRNHKGTAIGALVEVVGLTKNKTGAPAMQIVASGMSDPATGTFEFHNVIFPGHYVVTARSPFFAMPAMVEGDTSVDHPDAEDLVLTFPDPVGSSGRVRGVVLLPDGTPVGEGVPVSISWAPDYGVLTGPDGRFDTQIDLPWGVYDLEARDPVTGFRGRGAVAVRSGPVDVTIQLLGLGDLRVEVRDARGAPVDSADVTISRATFPSDEFGGETEADGVLELPDVVEGTYYAKACILGASVSLCGQGGTKVPLDGAATIAITLESTGSLDGIFVASDRVTPIPFAQVVIQDLGLAVTDSAGRFHLDDVPLGKYLVTANDQATGRYARAEANVDRLGAAASVTLIVRALGDVSGHVIDSDATSFVAGAPVILTPSDVLTPPVTVTTDPSGAFVVPGMPSGAFRLDARHPSVLGISGSADGVVPEDGGSVSVDVALTPRASIAGSIFDADGSPAAFARVELGGEVKQAGPDGHVAFSGLALGRHTVLATSSDPGQGASAGAIELRLDAGGPAPDFMITLSGVGSVGGTVRRANGVPSAGAAVTLRAPDSLTAFEALVLTGADGSYNVVGVPPGPFEVSVTDGTTGASGEGDVAGPGDHAVVDLTLGPTGSISGRVIGEVGASPLADAVVTVRYTPPSGFSGARTTTSDDAGHFAIDDIPSGSIALDVSHNVSHGLARRTLTLGAGVSLGTGDIVLDQAWPSVVASSPTAGASGVESTVIVRLTFSEPLDGASLKAAGVRLQGPSGVVAATLSQPSPEVVELTPTAPLASLTNYSVVVTGGLVQGPGAGTTLIGPTDRVGRPLLQSFSASFTTGDDDPPGLVSMSPADGEVEVAPQAPIRLVFDEPVRATGASVFLTGPSGLVAGRLDVGLNGLALVFTPQVALQVNATYQVVASGVSDLAGNLAEAQPFTATFVTLDTVGPTIVQLHIAGDAPALGGTTVPIEAILATPEPGVRVRMSVALVPFGETAPGSAILPYSLPRAGVVNLSAVAIDSHGNHGPPATTQLVVIQIPSIEAGPDRSAGEGASLALAALFDDDTVGAAHTATVDWGEGAGPEPVAVDELGDRVDATHAYADDGLYDVSVCVTGAAPYPSCDGFVATIDNAVPTLVAGPIVIDEGPSRDVDLAVVSDPGAADVVSVAVDWADATGPHPAAIGAGGRVHVARAFPDDQTRSVTLMARDDDGGVSSAVVPLTVRNVAPTVSLGIDQTLTGNGRMLRDGTFADPGSDTWTATVDWADGTPVEALMLRADKTFTLDHTYGAVGIYAVAVTLADDDGGSASDTVVIDIQSLAPPELTTPREILVSPSLVGQLPIRSNRPAPAGGLVVSLSHSNPSAATLPTSITIPAGAVVVNAPVTALVAGVSDVVASAPGYIGDTTRVTVRVVSAQLTPDDDYLLAVGDTRTHTVAITSPAPLGGLTITLASDDDAVATVTPTSVTVPEGELVATASVAVAGRGEGEATVTASAPGVTSASFGVETGVPTLTNPYCPNGTSVGLGLYHEQCAIVTRVAGQNYRVSSALPIVVSSSDGRSSSVQTIPAGQFSSTMQLDGLALGSDTLTFSADGWTPVELPVSVVPLTVAWSGVEVARNTQSAPDDVTLALATAAGTAWSQAARAPIDIALDLEPGSTAGIVGFEDAGGASVTRATVPAGTIWTTAYISRPSVAGSYRARATLPTGAAVTSPAVSVTAPRFTLGLYCPTTPALTGLGMGHDACYVTRNVDGQHSTPSTPLTLSFSSAEGRVSIAPVTIAANQWWAYFRLGGAALGADTVTVSDPNGIFAPVEFAVEVREADVQFSGLDVARNTASARNGLTLYVRVPGLNENLVPLAPASMTLSVSDATSPDIVAFYAAATGGNAITSLPVTGAFTSLWVGTPTAVGSYRVRAAIGDFVTSDSALVTVVAPQYTLRFEGCGATAYTGAGLIHSACYIRRYLNGALHSPPTPLTVTFTSANGRVVVPSVTLAANTSIAGYELEGVSTGSDTITAAVSGTALPYDSPSQAVEVQRGVVRLNGIATPRNPLSPRDDVYLTFHVAALNDNLMLRAAANIDLSLSTAEPPGIVSFYSGTATTSPIASLTVPARAAVSSTFYLGQPQTTGRYVAHAAGPSEMTGDSALVTVEEAVLTLELPTCSTSTQQVASELEYADCYVRPYLNGQLYTVPAPLTVSLSSSSPSIGVDATVTVPSGGTIAYFDIWGIASGSGAVTAAAPGYLASASIAVVSGTPAVYLNDLASSVGFAGDTFWLSTGVRNGPARPVHATRSFDLVAAPASFVSVAAMTSIGAGASTGPTLRMSANNTGAATLTASAPGWTSAAAAFTATVASTGIVIDADQIMLSYLPGVTATDSTGDTTQAMRAIDHALTTAWSSAWHATNVYAWWRVDFPDPVTVDAVHYFSGSTSVGNNVDRATFTFLGESGETLGELVDVALPVDGTGAELPLADSVSGVVAVRMTVTSPLAQQNNVDQIGEVVVIGIEE